MAQIYFFLLKEHKTSRASKKQDFFFFFWHPNVHSMLQAACEMPFCVCEYRSIQWRSTNTFIYNTREQVLGYTVLIKSIFHFHATNNQK